MYRNKKLFIDEANYGTTGKRERTKEQRAQVMKEAHMGLNELEDRDPKLTRYFKIQAYNPKQYP